MPTTALELSLLVLTLEFALIAIAIVGFTLHGGRRTQAVQITAATSLVTKVEATEAARRDALSAIFRDTYNFDAAESERVVTDFIERERAFYNAMIGVHLGRGGKSLDDVPAELTKVIAPWLRLTPKNMINADAVQALENANSMLNQELTSTKRVLDELMEEYNAAFHKEQQRRGAATDPQPGAVDDSHDRLSIDDSVPRETSATLSILRPEPPDTSPTANTAENLDEEIIALDLDLPDSELPSSEPLTPNDLDLLMENLESEYKPESVAA
ncbi:MAG: hypothetical protein HYX63_05085 [Gammaproteobacteria bacterium]|nr:hypothetical protein [Gammaproteobacteria bacterium]